MHNDEINTENIVSYISQLNDKSSEGDSHSLVKKCFFFKGSPIAVSVVLSEAGSADEKGSIAVIQFETSGTRAPSTPTGWCRGPDAVT